MTFRLAVVGEGNPGEALDGWRVEQRVASVSAVDPGSCDCVVGVPADRPAELAARVGACPVPGVVLVGPDQSAAGVATHAPVVRRGPGAGAALRRRVAAAVEGAESEEAALGDGGVSAPARGTDLLERAGEGVVLVDGDRTVSYLNDAAATLFEADAETAVGAALGELVAADGAVDRAVADAEGRGEVATVEAHEPSVDAWLAVRAHPDEGVALYVRDVTDRHRAEEELTASRSALRALHETVSDTDVGRQETLERVLAVGRDRLGVDAGLVTEVSGDTWRVEAVVGDHPELAPGTTAPLSETICRQVVGTDQPLCVSDATGETGAEEAFACYLGTELTVDGEPYGTVCFGDASPRRGGFTEAEEAFVEMLADWVRYVVERDAYEAELRRQTRRLETLTEHVPVVLFALDDEGTVTLSRGKGLEALDAVPGEAVGESVFDLYENYPTVVDRVERALEGEHGHHTVEIEGGVLEVWYQPVFDEEGAVEQVVGVARDITEPERRQAQLERERAFVESVLDSLPDPLYAFDEDGTLVRWNDRVATVTGYDDDRLAGMHAEEFIADHDHEVAREAIEAVNEGERVSFEADIVTADGEFLPYELSGAPVTEDGEVVGATGVARDVSDQQARREMLSGLLDATGQLMQARGREEVAEVAVTAAESVLGFDINLVRLYDREAGTLVPAARTERMAAEMGERPVYEVGEGNPGEVFASGEPRVLDDVSDDDVTGRGDVRSLLCYPMGVHGTISVGATEPDAFDETDQQVLALLATSAAAACTRAKREREVREAREHTETVLTRVNGLVENTVEVLVEARTREELAEGVVAELAAAEPYTFAWFGSPDVASETLAPSTWAGEAAVPVEELSFDLTRDNPVARAYRTGEVQVVDDVAARADELPCAAAVAGEDIQASIVVPLEYTETTYGVLTVFAGEAGAFDEREQVVLEAIGQAVANAVNAVERGRIMDATEIIELEFTVSDPDLLFSRLSRGADCRVAVAGTDYRSDGSLRLYLTATDADADRLVALAREEAGVTDATLIADTEDDCLLELTVEDSLLGTLTDLGAVPREAVGEDGTARFTVELPYEGEAREVFEAVERRYPSTDLVGYHERERPVETRQEFRAALSDRFTDRQEEALRTAYLGGFFEWPRDIDGNELADAMDISRPTYHQHLRAAQRKVLEELFE